MIKSLHTTVSGIHIPQKWNKVLSRIICLHVLHITRILKNLIITRILMHM